MPSAIQIRIRTNTISPQIAKLARGISDKRPILEAMGLALVSYTKRSFNDASLRGAVWPPKKDGTPSRLKKTGALWQSIRIVNLGKSSVTVGSDRVYAAVHQFGSTKVAGRGSGIPARPFFPFISGRIIPRARQSIESAAMAKIRALTE